MSTTTITVVCTRRFGWAKNDGSSLSFSSSAAAVGVARCGPLTWPSPSSLFPAVGWVIWSAYPRRSATRRFSRGWPRGRLRDRPLPARDTLQPLHGVVEPQRQRLDDRLPAAHQRDQRSAGEQVRDVVLSQV